MPKVEMNMPELPDGWEYTGEYRKPMAGDYILDYAGDVVHVEWKLIYYVPIIRRVPKLCEVLDDVSS